MSKCKITGKVLAIQLGRDQTQIALMGKGSELLHAVSVPTPEGAVEDGTIRNPDALRDMLKETLKTPEFKSVKRVVFSLCTSQIISETVTTPDLPAGKLEKLLMANMDMYFPVDMKDYQLIWQVVCPREKENGLKELMVQLWAVPISMLGRYYTVANACGLSVEAIDFCGHSIATAVGASFAKTAKAVKAKKKLSLNTEISFGKKKKEEALEPQVEMEDSAVATETRYVPDTQLYLCVDSDLIGMTFVQEDQVVLQRFIQCGFDPSYQFGEVAMMVEYFRSLDVGRGSFISGTVIGSLAEDELVTEMADVIGVSLTRYINGCGPQWVVCSGAARTTMDFGIPALNKKRRQGESQLWQYILVLAGGLAVVGVVMLTLSSRLVWKSTLQGLESTKQTLTIQAQKTAGYADNYNAYSSAYENYSADWETVFSSLRTYNDNLVLVLEELEEILPKNTSVTAMQIAADSLTVQFACEDKEEAAYLIMALRELKYADLAGISNLSGGGAGPATSYGSGEAPPTEGSYTQNSPQEAEAAEAVWSCMNGEPLLMVILSSSPEQVELLETTYGSQSATGDYKKIEDLEALGDIEFELRSGAVYEMLTTNPFTMNRFLNMVQAEKEYVTTGGGMMKDTILLKVLVDDLMKEENADLVPILMGESAMEPEQLPSLISRLAGILVSEENDGENLTATENMFRTDAWMEQWYVYYLGVQMDVVAIEQYPYLNMNRIITDLRGDGFATKDLMLDQMLTSLISTEAQAKVDALTDDQTGGDTTEPGTDDLKPVEPTEPTDSTEEPTEPSEAPTEPTEDNLINGYTKDELVSMVNKYMTSGHTIPGDKVDKFLATGTTGDAELDKKLYAYMNGGGAGAETPTEPTEPSEPDSGVDITDVNGMMQNIIQNGTTGDKNIDRALYKYATTGESGMGSYVDQKLDQKFAEYGFSKEYLLLFLKDPDADDGDEGETGDGNNTNSGGSVSGDALGELLEQIMGNNGTTGGEITGDGTGGTQTPQDTRIYFVVALTYNEELQNAELERKGLDYDEKIEKVEVEE